MVCTWQVCLESGHSHFMPVRVILFILIFLFPVIVCVLPGLSVELQTVLRMMLAPELSVRATVPELLTLPVVRRHRWRRNVSLLLRETLLILVTFCQVGKPSRQNFPPPSKLRFNYNNNTFHLQSILFKLNC